MIYRKVRCPPHSKREGNKLTPFEARLLNLSVGSVLEKEVEDKADSEGCKTLKRRVQVLHIGSDRVMVSVTNLREPSGLWFRKDEVLDFDMGQDEWTVVHDPKTVFRLNANLRPVFDNIHCGNKVYNGVHANLLLWLTEGGLTSGETDMITFHLLQTIEEAFVARDLWYGRHRVIDHVATYDIEGAKDGEGANASLNIYGGDGELSYRCNPLIGENLEQCVKAAMAAIQERHGSARIEVAADHTTDVEWEGDYSSVNFTVNVYREYKH